jgi:chromosome segregation ATPase
MRKAYGTWVASKEKIVFDLSSFYFLVQLNEGMIMPKVIYRDKDISVLTESLKVNKDLRNNLQEEKDNIAFAIESITSEFLLLQHRVGRLKIFTDCVRTAIREFETSYDNFNSNDLDSTGQQLYNNLTSRLEQREKRLRGVEADEYAFKLTLASLRKRDEELIKRLKTLNRNITSVRNELKIRKEDYVKQHPEVKKVKKIKKALKSTKRKVK